MNDLMGMGGHGVACNGMFGLQLVSAPRNDSHNACWKHLLLVLLTSFCFRESCYLRLNKEFSLARFPRRSSTDDIGKDWKIIREEIQKVNDL